jgi:hypothetical protein
MAQMAMAVMLPIQVDGIDRRIQAETTPEIQEAIHEPFGVIHPPSHHDHIGNGWDHDFWVDELSTVAHQRLTEC